jgi:hypothetical protein
MNTIDIGKDFFHRLVNRDENQTDGKFTAVDFREKYLSKLDNKEAWSTEGVFIVFDFKNIKKIGPSFANGAFGYFMKYTNPEKFLDKVKFINISDVHRIIIKEELESGFKGT